MTDAEAAADAFDALSDPTRVAILRELVSQFYEHDGRPVGFADLRRAVGVDDPGRFNYHLEKLRDRFVVSGEEGYTPTVAGLKAVESAETGLYTEEHRRMTGTIDYDCSDCGEPLTATYENHWISVACDEHGLQFKTLVFSSVGPDDELGDVVADAVREMWRRIGRVSDGICPICRSRSLSLTFRETDRGILGDCACEACFYRETNVVALFALAHPAVLSLLHDHGFDVPQQLPFEGISRLLTESGFVDDGRAVELRIAVEGDGVTIRVGDDLTVEAV